VAIQVVVFAAVCKIIDSVSTETPKRWKCFSLCFTMSVYFSDKRVLAAKK
jgi:hypothetical protein